MNYKKNKGVSSLNVIIIFLAVILLGLSAYAVSMFNDLLTSDTIYKGIYVNEMDVSGMTKDQLRQKLIETQRNVLEEKSIAINYDGGGKVIKYTDIGMKVNIEETVKKVWNVGRVGNTKDKILEIASAYLNKKEFYTNVKYNDLAVEKVISQIYDEIFVKRVDNSYKIEGNKLTLVSGTDGKELDRTVLAEKLYDLLDKLKSGEIDAPTLIYPRKNVDANQIFKEIFVMEKSASVKVENNDVKIIPEKEGRNIDLMILKESVNELMTKQNVEIPLRIETVIPKTTAEEIESKLFRDVLHTASTTFETYTENGKNRGINIGLAADTIKGTILPPGGVFSFNDVVGERSQKRGYQVAHVYLNGEIVDGIGGGICQVSSTLYNAVLYSGLDITERLNHQFTVSYVEIGTDATVSYGEVDFKFKNNTNWPIKIENVKKENSISFTIYGTDENPDRTISVKSNIIKEYPFKTVEEKVTTLKPGETKVKQYGMTGYYVSTKRIFKEGEDVREEDLGYSWYSKRDKIVQVGVKPEELDKEQKEQQS